MNRMERILRRKLKQWKQHSKSTGYLVMGLPSVLSHIKILIVAVPEKESLF